MKYYLAIDIGASSGRHIVGWQENGLHTDEVFRFEGYAKKQNKHLVWDLDALTDCVIKGIAKAFAKYSQIESLAIDTWGVDYVLMDGNREILPCLSYRDRTESVIDRVHSIVPFAELYARTGIQFQPFNTIYQLFDDKLRGRLQMATDFLMMPEYLAYRLTGNKTKEYTNATTTGLVNAQTGSWDMNIIRKLGLNEKLFGTLKKAGTTVGKLSQEVAMAVGGQTKVVLCATHDTASAVAGIPMDGNELYISSGTWSLLGVKTEHALTDENSRKANYSNEGGVGYNRYQKNIMGMWVVNELRKELCPDKPFAEIVTEAQTSSFAQTVDVNHADFLAPQSMVQTFEKHLTLHPKTTADYFNCAFLSLALSYKQAIAELEHNVGQTYSKLYIVGGGAKNSYLNRLTEQATGKQVVALPIEATALGNLKLQIQRD